MTETYKKKYMREQAAYDSLKKERDFMIVEWLCVVASFGFICFVLGSV
jgi:hypothetical protein